LHQARGRYRKRHQQSRPAHPPPGERAGVLLVAVMVVMPMVVTGMTVIMSGMVMMIV
jgi:hypothetical protein